jgi:hypothetical protein
MTHILHRQRPGKRQALYFFSQWDATEPDIRANAAGTSASDPVNAYQRPLSRCESTPDSSSLRAETQSPRVVLRNHSIG